MLYINYKNEDGTIETIEDMRGMSKTDKKELINNYNMLDGYYASTRASKEFYTDNNRKIILVYNLSNDTEYHFLDMSEMRALIYCYMINNSLTSQLHNEEKRKELKSKITYAKYSMLLGDYCVRNDTAIQNPLY